MAVPFIMPKLEMAQETATVIEWLKQEGEQVEKGEPLLTVETDKVTVDIESPASGILAGIRVEPGQVVPVTEVIAYVLQPGEKVPESPPSVPFDKLPSTMLGTGRAGSPASGGDGLEGWVGQIRATPVAQRVAEAHGVDLSTVVGTGAGGRITRADVEAALPALSSPTIELSSDKVRATPAARRIARERGVDLPVVTGSGPRGRVQAADVLALALTPGPSPDFGRGEKVIPLQGMRRTIAERMTASYQTAPHITFTIRVDMSGFEEVRARLNAKAEATGHPRVSVTALIVKAVAWALKRHPWLNSTLRQGSGQALRGEEVHLLPEINVGVAVALPLSFPPNGGDEGGGLIVPVVHQADGKSVAEIGVEVSDLVARAREGRLTPADVAGGTFTVSNLGPFGIEQFTAIINPPQAAILAVGATQPEVVVDEGGQVVVRPVMRMTLSADHRVVDGAMAARFLTDLREALEAPALLLW